MKTLCGIILIMLYLSAPLSGQTTCDSITSPSTNDEDFSVMHAQDGNDYMAWFSDSTGTPDIWIRRSTDSGYSWDSTWLAISNPDNNWYPNLRQTSDGTYHLVWFRNFIANGTHDVHYSKSTDLFNWSIPQNLTDSSSVDWVPNLLVDNNDVLWITWPSSRTGQQELFSIHSSDGGDNWTHPTQLTNHPEQDAMPYLHQRTNGTYFMVWQRYSTPIFQYVTDSSDIWYATSPDGLNWSTPDSITYDTTIRHVEILPAIYEDAATQKLYFTWTGARYNPLGSIMHFALSDLQAGQLGDQAQEISCGGYFGRVHPTDTPTKLHVFFVSDRDGDINRDISHTVLDKSMVTVENEMSTFLPSIFPNPITDCLNIRVPEGMHVTHLQLQNINGEILIQKQVAPTNLIRLEGLLLPNGIYFLQLRSSEGISGVQKIVVLGAGG